MNRPNFKLSNLFSKSKLILITAIIITTIAATTKLSAATIYIDPTNNASGQNGSQTNPYNSWSKVTFTSGNTYLQKNGTTYTTSVSLSLSGKSNITLGTYGSGSRAKILSTGSGNHIINVSTSSNITIKDLEITSSGDWISGVIIQGSGSSTNLVDNCLIHGTEWGIRIITTASGNRILNSTIHDIGDDGIYVKDASSIEIGHCNIYDINTKFFINPDQSYSAGDGIQIASTNNMNFNIHDNIIDHSSTGNKFCFIAWGSNYTGIIENNVMIGNSAQTTSAMYLSPTTNTVIVRYNTIKNSNYGIYSYANLLDAYYNVFSENKTAISVLPNYTLNARNNVFYNNANTAISATSSSPVTLRNNIFHITSSSKAINASGSVTSNNNVFNMEHSSFINGHSTLSSWKNASGNDAASMVGNPAFVSGSSGDFHLQSNSVAINKGSNVNLSRDFYGSSVPQSGTPDIGIHEVVGGQSSGNNAPIIANQGFSVTQTSPVGTVVGTVFAQDPDAGQTLSYSIISGNTNSTFSINPSSGQLTVATTLPLQNFNLTIKVTDNGSPIMSSQAVVSINVSTSAGNQAPIIANQSFSISQGLTIGSFVGKVVASDPNEGQSISYSIVAGNTNATFAISATSGNITVAKALPLQNFNLTVKVTDNGSPAMSSQAIVTINITAGSTNQPPYLPASTYSVKHYAPNGTFVGKLTGSDPNPGQTITYKIVSGNTDNAFTLNATNGALNVKNSRALDIKKNPKFLLKVKVTDNGQPNMSFTQTITVNVVRNKMDDEITEIEEMDVPKEILVYPNPSVDGRFSVSFGRQCETAKLEAFDLSGRLVKSITVTQSAKGTIDLSTSPNGAYLIRLDTGTEVKTLKAVKYQ